MTKGREEEARKILFVLRERNDVAVEEELDLIKEGLATMKLMKPYDKLRERHVMWAVFIGVFLAFAQQLTGCNAVNSYAPEVLKDAGFSASDSTTQAIYIGVSKLVFVIVALMIMDRAGRRLLLLLGTSGMCVSLVSLGLLLRFPGQPPILSALSLFIYMGFFEISLGPVMWLMLSELYPLQVKGVAMSFGSTACWIFTVLVTLLFPVVSSLLGTSGVFFMFSVVAFVAIVFMYFFVPETKGKSLEKIETMLREGKLD
jgi:MFS family permease